MSLCEIALMVRDGASYQHGQLGRTELTLLRIFWCHFLTFLVRLSYQSGGISFMFLHHDFRGPGTKRQESVGRTVIVRYWVDMQELPQRQTVSCG